MLYEHYRRIRSAPVAVPFRRQRDALWKQQDREKVKEPSAIVYNIFLPVTSRIPRSPTAENVEPENHFQRPSSIKFPKIYQNRNEVRS